MRMLGSHTLIRINLKERLMILQIKDAWFRLLEHYGSKIVTMVGVRDGLIVKRALLS